MHRSRHHVVSYALFAAISFGAVAAPTSATAQNLFCQVKVVHYVDGGKTKNLVSQFYFADGRQYYCDKDYDKGRGEAAYCDSNTNVKCTKKVSTVVRLVVGGESFTLTDTTEDAPDGQCYTLIPYEVGPAFTVNRETAGSADSAAERAANKYWLKYYDPSTGTFQYRPLQTTDEDFDSILARMKSEVDNANSAAQ